MSYVTVAAAAAAAAVGVLYLRAKIMEASECDNSEDWHISEELYRAFQRFHDKYAGEPRESISRAMRIHYDYMQEVSSFFRRRGICHYLEFTGSSYESVKVKNSPDNDDLEFDVMMIIDIHKYELEAIPMEDKPGYAWLKLRPEAHPSPSFDKALSYWNMFGIFTGTKYVDASKTMDLFFSELQKCINDSSLMTGKVELRRHGPAVQMDVHPDSGFFSWGPRLFSVDVVPTYNVVEKLFVCKPIKDETMTDDLAWRHSFSLYEKNKLTGGSKKVLRVLKVLRNREPGLKSLTSYHLKTALFYEMDGEYDWSERLLALRFMGVLRRLEEFLTNGRFPHYFIRNINLLSSMSSRTISNIRDKIIRLRTKKNEMMKILNS